MPVKKTAGKMKLHPVAELYRYSTLDPMVEIARAVSHDFIRRPQHYRKVPGNVVEIFENLRHRTGSHPDWPSAIQRTEIYLPIFGAQFCAGSLSLQGAAAAMIETPQSADDGPLRQVVRDSAATLRGHLGALEGDSLSSTERQMSKMFLSAVEVFRCGAVSRAFGLTPIAAASWPFDSECSENIGCLVKEIARSLRLPHGRLAMNQHRFLSLNRVAHYGSLTLADVMEGSENREEGLIENAYAWQIALRQMLVSIDVVRAWKDREYRESLSATEQSQVAPNPAGDVDLGNAKLGQRAAGVAYDTLTVDQVCCCTGDLPCPQASEYSDYCCPTNLGFTCPTTDCGSGCNTTVAVAGCG